MGFRCQTISRNTLANANATRPWQIYADFAQHLITLARPLYAKDPLHIDLDATVYAFDATTTIKGSESLTHLEDKDSDPMPSVYAFDATTAIKGSESLTHLEDKDSDPMPGPLARKTRTPTPCPVHLRGRSDATPWTAQGRPHDPTYFRGQVDSVRHGLQSIQPRVATVHTMIHCARLCHACTVTTVLTVLSPMSAAEDRSRRWQYVCPGLSRTEGVAATTTPYDLGSLRVDPCIAAVCT